MLWNFLSCWAHVVAYNCLRRFTSSSVNPISTIVSQAPRLIKLDLSLNPLSSIRQNALAGTKEGGITLPIGPLLDALSSANHHYLEELDLSCIGPWRECVCSSDVSDLKKFLGAMDSSQSRLRRISLRSLELTDEHATVISRLIAHQASLFEIIDLSGNAISDIGAAKFAYVLDRTRSLRVLSLDANQVRFVLFS